MHQIATSMWTMLSCDSEPEPSETACMPITTSSTRMMRNDVDTISSAARWRPWRFSHVRPPRREIHALMFITFLRRKCGRLAKRERRDDVSAVKHLAYLQQQEHERQHPHR
jgi:hypothetical protein